MAAEVFISYSRRDLHKVRQIKETIDNTLNINCWMDLDGIESGEQFKNIIISAINRHNTFVFMLSSNSMKSEWALDEIDFARRKNKRIVLLKIDNSEMNDEFYFSYHKYDIIEWDNQVQRNKLFRNLQEWFKLGNKIDHSHIIFTEEEEKLFIEKCCNFDTHYDPEETRRRMQDNSKALDELKKKDNKKSFFDKWFK